MSNNDASFRDTRAGDAPDYMPTFWEGWDDRTDPREVFTTGWNHFRERSYHDLQLLRDRLQERARAVRKVEPTGGESPQERNDFMVENWEELIPLRRARWFFIYRARAAEALMRYIEEKGAPPKWENVSAPVKKTIQEAIQDSPQTAYKTREAVRAMQEFFHEVDETPEMEIPDEKKKFFDEIASRSSHLEKWKNVQGCVDEFCKNHGIDVPSSPHGYRKILNQERNQE